MEDLEGSFIGSGMDLRTRIRESFYVLNRLHDLFRVKLCAQVSSFYWGKSRKQPKVMMGERSLFFCDLGHSFQRVWCELGHTFPRNMSDLIIEYLF